MKTMKNLLGIIVCLSLMLVMISACGNKKENIDVETITIETLVEDNTTVEGADEDATSYEIIHEGDGNNSVVDIFTDAADENDNSNTVNNETKDSNSGDINETSGASDAGDSNNNTNNNTDNKVNEDTTTDDGWSDFY